MAQYIVTVNATSNSSGNTEDTWIEVFPGSGVSVLIKRIRVSIPHTTVQDVPVRVRLQRATAAGATGTSFTPIKKRSLSPAAGSSCNVKNGTNAFSVGTTDLVLMDVAFNSRGVFEWVPRDEKDYYESDSNERIALLLRINAASIVCNCELEFEE